jgi:2-dehydropantoate 2-reductase
VLDPEGRVLHLSDGGTISFGERAGPRTARVTAIAEAFAVAKVDGGPSDTILQEMWEKWAFISTAAGITCLMRAAVGDIVAAGAADRTLALYDEIASVAAAQGFAPRPPVAQRGRTMLTTPGSPFTASMLRDVESGRAIEADHMLGDLLKRSGKTDGLPMLRLAYAHLKAYESRRARTGIKP